MANFSGVAGIRQFPVNFIPAFIAQLILKVNQKIVDVITISQIRGRPAAGRMQLGQKPRLFKIPHVAAYRGRTDFKLTIFRRQSRSDWFGGLDKFFDYKIKKVKVSFPEHNVSIILVSTRKSRVPIFVLTGRSCLLESYFLAAL